MSEINQKELKIVIPKGSLQSDTLKFFQKAGYDITGYRSTDRSYRPEINDAEIKLKVSRPQEIPIYVERGYHDLGITGIDWVLETNANVEPVLDLKYGEIDIVLAVPNSENGSPWREVNSFEDLRDMGKKDIRIATEYLSISSNYIINRVGVEPSVITPWSFLTQRRRHTSNITLILSFGATEGKPPDEADAIIDNSTSSRRTLTANKLKVIEILMTSTARLIANPKALSNPWKREKIEEVRQALTKGLTRKRRELISAHL